MKRILAIAIAISICLSIMPVAFSNGAEDMKDSGVDYTESIKMLDNPHMGYPRVAGYTLAETGTPIRNDSGFVWYYVNLQKFSAGNNLFYDTYEDKTPPFGGVDKPISQSALDAFSETLNNLRLNGGSALIRFVYDWDGIKGCEPSNFDMMVTHVEQLCDVVSKYDDIVLGFECGIIGVYGEMHSSIYTDKQYTNRIIDAYLDNTPESMILMLRTPWNIANYLGESRETLANVVTEKGSKEYRLGIYNDGYMNSGSDLGTWVNRAQEIKFLENQSEHTTYGGEYGSAYETTLLPNEACVPENAIPEMYRTHVNFIRGNVYKIGGKNDVFGYDQFIYSSQYEKEWFPDNSAFYGEDCHTFITAHLGYRLVLRESKLSASPRAGGTLELSGSIENTGFANILHNPDAQILLVKDGAAYTCDVALDAFDIKSCTTYNYDFTLSLPSSMAAGDYEVYLRLAGSDESFYSCAKSGIQFANNGGIYNTQFGANKLGTVTVADSDEIKSAASDVFAQTGVTKPGAKVTTGAPQLLGYGFNEVGTVPLSFNAGDDVTLSSLNQVNPKNGVSYQWFKNGALISDSQDLIISGITASNAGVYKLTVTANSNSYTTIALNISVTTNSFSDYITTVEPTCSSTGEAARTCGDLTETKILPALSHVSGNLEIVPSTCTVRGREIIPCARCNETISYKLLTLKNHDFSESVAISPTCTKDGELLRVCVDCGHQETEVIKAAGHPFEYTIEENIVSGLCPVCGEVMGPKTYNGVATGHDAVSAAPLKFGTDTIVMVGDGGLASSYQTKSTTDSLTFLFRITGVETPITLAKLRTQTYSQNNQGNIADSNNAPNYYGEGAYKVTEDGVWALSMTAVVMNFTGNNKFGGVTWAAFYDPESTKGTSKPVNKNENSTFEMLGIYDGTLSYDVIFVGTDGGVLDRQIGGYNQNVQWVNLIARVNDVDSLYKGAVPAKPSDSEYTYTFDGWVDSDGNPINPAIGNIIAYASFTATPIPAEQAIAEAKEALTWDIIKNTNTSQDSVTDSLNLITDGASGVGICWTSSEPDIITETGDVMRPDYESGDKTVVLTATITKGDKSDTLRFTLKVTAAPKESGDGGNNTGGGSGGGSSKPSKKEDNLPETSVAVPTIEEYINPYNDVTQEAWFYEAVKFVTENNLMKGVYDDEFSPNTNITRAMLVTILYRIEGEPAMSENGVFKDVRSGQWYTDAIAWAGLSGIVTGYSDGNFGPDDAVTREQLITILYRYGKSKELDVDVKTELTNYSDISQISDWALPAMQWAVAEGIIKGQTETALVPQGSATRAEIAAILERYLKNLN